MNPQFRKRSLGDSCLTVNLWRGGIKLSKNKTFAMFDIYILYICYIFLQYFAGIFTLCHCISFASILDGKKYDHACC